MLYHSCAVYLVVSTKAKTGSNLTGPHSIHSQKPIQAAMGTKADESDADLYPRYYNAPASHRFLTTDVFHSLEVPVHHNDNGQVWETTKQKS